MCVFIMPVVVCAQFVPVVVHVDPVPHLPPTPLASRSLISGARNVASHRHLLRASKLTEDFLDIAGNWFHIEAVELMTDLFHL
jgi:hypothetical protein